jgi:signal transduction histidine kinase
MPRSNRRPPRSARSGRSVLARAIGRIPINVGGKLVAAFVMVVGLLIAVGSLGIGAIGQSNDRVDALGSLPQRQAAYRELAIDGDQLSSLLVSRDNYVVCIVGKNQEGCPPHNALDDARNLAAVDGATALTLNQISLLIDAGNLGFVPPLAEQRVLSSIAAEYRRIAGSMTAVASADQVGNYGTTGTASDEVNALTSHADALVGITQADTANLIAQEQASYLASQHLFIAVAVASIVLAVLIAAALSGSITAPIRTIDSGVAAVAAGDFSRRVEVPNRDELGTLGANINRMSEELERLYGQLEDASRHKSEFLANMSHELRTPLNAILGFCDVLDERFFGDLNEKQAAYVADIRRSGGHLLTLINDILDLSKIEAGRLELHTCTFSLAELIQNSAKLMRDRAMRLGIGLKLDVSASTGIVEADERMLKQVLFNLLSNALKFTQRGGFVEVIGRGDVEAVEVSVQDNGVGLAPSDHSRIFEEFEQVGARSGMEGTGLGLAISRRFVDLHGGRLWVESALGQGSTFTFVVPRSQPQPVAALNDVIVAQLLAGATVPSSDARG